MTEETRRSIGGRGEKPASACTAAFAEAFGIARSRLLVFRRPVLLLRWHYYCINVDSRLLFNCFFMTTTTPSSMQDCFADRRPAWTVPARVALCTAPGPSSCRIASPCDSGTQKYHPAFDACAISNQDIICTSFYLLSRVLCVASHQWTC